MKRALAAELNEDAVPALVLRVSKQRFRELFPVALSAVDPFAEAEPSEAALVRLKEGFLALINFGTITNRVTVSVPVSSDIRETIQALLREVPLRRDEIIWIAEALHGELKVREMIEFDHTASKIS